MLSARRRPRGDEGTTLAELVVCMALTTVVGAMALSFFLWTGSSTRTATASSFSLQTSRIAVSTVTGILRLAVPGTVTPTTPNLTTGLSTSVTFNASDSLVAGCSARPTAIVTLIVAGTNVRMDRSGPVNAPVAGDPCRYLANQPTSKILIRNTVSGTGFRATDSTAAANPTITPANVAAVTFFLSVASTGATPQSYQATAVISGDAP